MAIRRGRVMQLPLQAGVGAEESFGCHTICNMFCIRKKPPVEEHTNGRSENMSLNTGYVKLLVLTAGVVVVVNEKNLPW